MVSIANPLIVGRITAVYGVRGWLKVYSYTQPIENLLNYSQHCVKRNNAWQPLCLVEGHRHGKGLVVRIDGVDDNDAAVDYCQCDLAVPVTALPALAVGEFYWHQLQGLQVITAREQILLGTVHHLLETGANDVLVVRGGQGSIDRRERLIPYLPERVVLEVNVADGWIRVDWDPEF